MSAVVLSQHRTVPGALETAPEAPKETLQSPSGYGWLESIVAAFDPVDLSAITGAALLDRTEIKYVLPAATLGPVLEDLGDGYTVLSVEGHRVNRYRTLYFDTLEFTMYHRNLAGAGDRYKVRAREYVETSTSFLEIKHKTNKDRTIKSRIPTPELATSLDVNSALFLEEHSPFGAGQLVPCLLNRYLRITFVHKHRPERVTFDFDLGFEWRGKSVHLPGVVVAEVKMDATRRQSEFVTVMRSHHIRSTGFSKFCIGVSLVYPEIKQNQLRVKHRLLARIMQGNAHHGLG